MPPSRHCSRCRRWHSRTDCRRGWRSGDGGLRAAGESSDKVDEVAAAAVEELLGEPPSLPGKAQKGLVKRLPPLGGRRRFN